MSKKGTKKELLYHEDISLFHKGFVEVWKKEKHYELVVCDQGSIMSMTFERDLIDGADNFTMCKDALRRINEVARATITLKHAYRREMFHKLFETGEISEKTLREFVPEKDLKINSKNRNKK